MKNILIVILWVLVTAFIGFNILALLDKKKILGNLECAGLSFLAGLGAVSIEMFLMGICGLQFRILVILIPWITLFLYNIIFSRNFFMRKLNFGKGDFSLSERIIFGLLSFEVIYTFFRALIKPIEAYDSVSIYALKSKILYLAGSIPNDFFTGILGHFHGVHVDYPLLVPISEVWFYVFNNGLNEFLVKSIFPLIFLCFLCVFYSVLKRLLDSRITALLFTFMLSSVAQFNAYATIGVADLALSINFGIAFFYLYQWMKNSKISVFLYISMLFSVFTIWTKNEGIILACIIFLITALYTILRHAYRDRGVLIRISAYIFVVCLFVLGWLGYRTSLGLVNENFNFSMITQEKLVSGIQKIPVILYEYQKQIFGFKKWNIAWVILLFLFITRFKASFKGYTLYATLAILLFFAGYSAVYIFSAVEIDFFLRKTASRFFIHILPVAIFWIASMTKEDDIAGALENA